MCIDVCVDMWMLKTKDMFIDICRDMCIGMCIGMCIAMCIAMSMDVCECIMEADMWTCICPDAALLGGAAP